MSLRKFGALLFACALVGFIPAGAAEAATLRQVFEAVNQAVVVVRTESSAPAPKGGWTSDEGLGSGVLVSADGKVMTAAHVVQTADRIEVLFSDGQRSPARVVSSLVRADVALLELERPPRGIAPARLGDSSQAHVGDPVAVLQVADFRLGAQTARQNDLVDRHGSYPSY